MNYYFNIILLFLPAVFSYGQTYHYYSAREYTYGPYYFDQSLNFVNKIFEDKKIAKDREEMKKAMELKTKEIKDYYESLKVYPEKVTDGWHEVVVIAGSEFIDDRKVYVKSNQIVKSVRGNWWDEEVSFSGPIINAKTGIKLKNTKPPLDGLLQVFFINFIANNSSEASPPLKPGQITFWTNSKKYDKVYLYFEDASFGPFKNFYKDTSPPACNSESEINIVYKPGLYKYKGVMRSGSRSRTLCEGVVEIKEDNCTLIQISGNDKTFCGCLW